VHLVDTSFHDILDFVEGMAVHMHIRRVVEESKEGDTRGQGPHKVDTCSYLALAFSCPAVNSSG
jgi:hypothetical protein